MGPWAPVPVSLLVYEGLGLALAWATSSLALVLGLP